MVSSDFFSEILHEFFLVSLLRLIFFTFLPSHFDNTDKALSVRRCEFQVKIFSHPLSTGFVTWIFEGLNNITGTKIKLVNGMDRKIRTEHAAVREKGNAFKLLRL